MNLVDAKRFITEKKNILGYDSISLPVEIINNIYGFSLMAIDESGGFKPRTEVLMTPCRTSDELLDVYQNRVITEIIQSMEKLDSGSPYYEGFKFILSHYFYGESPVFTPAYFQEHTAHEIAADLFIIQLMLYDIVIFPIDE